MRQELPPHIKSAPKYGTLLRRMRVKRGLTQSHIAKALKVQVPYISDVERGFRRALNGRQTETLARLMNLDAIEHNTFLMVSARDRGSLCPDCGACIEDRTTEEDLRSMRAFVRDAKKHGLEKALEMSKNRRHGGGGGDG